MTTTSFSVSGKRVVVVGAARSGVAAAELLVRRGASVTLSDMRDRLDEDGRLREQRLRGRHAGTEDDEIRAEDRLGRVPAELEADAGLAQLRVRVDRRARIAQRHRRAAPDEQRGGGDAAPRRADDDDLPARDGKGGGRHRSLRVVRLKSAKTIAAMTNRAMTFGSLQPISSK